MSAALKLQAMRKVDKIMLLCSAGVWAGLTVHKSTSQNGSLADYLLRDCSTVLVKFSAVQEWVRITT